MAPGHAPMTDHERKPAHGPLRILSFWAWLKVQFGHLYRDAAILALRHQITTLERQLDDDTEVRFTRRDRASLAAFSEGASAFGGGPEPGTAAGLAMIGPRRQGPQWASPRCGYRRCQGIRNPLNPERVCGWAKEPARAATGGGTRWSSSYTGALPEILGRQGKRPDLPP